MQRLVYSEKGELCADMRNVYNRMKLLYIFENHVPFEISLSNRKIETNLLHKSDLIYSWIYPNFSLMSSMFGGLTGNRVMESK